jgi:hypothetical protein
MKMMLNQKSYKVLLAKCSEAKSKGSNPMDIKDFITEPFPV